MTCKTRQNVTPYETEIIKYRDFVQIVKRQCYFDELATVANTGVTLLIYRLLQRSNIKLCCCLNTLLCNLSKFLCYIRQWFINILFRAKNILATASFNKLSNKLFIICIYQPIHKTKSLHKHFTSPPFTDTNTQPTCEYSYNTVIPSAVCCAAFVRNGRKRSLKMYISRWR